MKKSNPLPIYPNERLKIKNATSKFIKKVVTYNSQEVESHG